MRFKRYVWVICFSLFLPGDIFSQPFSYLDIGYKRSVLNSQTDSYTNRWNLTQAHSIQLHTPFYIGIVGLGIDFFDYEGISNDISDFSSANFFAYMGASIISIKHFGLKSGVSFGIQQLETNESEFESLKIERELFFSLGIEPQIKYRTLILYSDIQYRRIYNFYRQDILFIGLGLKVQIILPDRIRSFID